MPPTNVLLLRRGHSPLPALLLRRRHPLFYCAGKCTPLPAQVAVLLLRRGGVTPPRFAAAAPGVYPPRLESPTAAAAAAAPWVPSFRFYGGGWRTGWYQLYGLSGLIGSVSSASTPQNRQEIFAMLKPCKDCPYGQAGKLGFHKNMKKYEHYGQEYYKNLIFGARIWVPSPNM